MPAQARPVAAAQREVSGSPLTIRDSSPAAAGPEPMATTVPTATPVWSTAAKKASWYAATPTPASQARPRRRHAPASPQGTGDQPQQQRADHDPDGANAGRRAARAQRLGGAGGAEADGGQEHLGAGG